MEKFTNQQQRFEKTSETDAGYPVFERRQVAMQHVAEEWPAPEYEALEKPQQRGRLRLALAAVGALGVAGVGGKALVEYQAATETSEHTYEASLQPADTSSKEHVRPKARDESLLAAESADATTAADELPPVTSLRPRARQTVEAEAGQSAELQEVVSNETIRDASYSLPDGVDGSVSTERVEQHRPAFTVAVPSVQDSTAKLGLDFGTVANSTPEQRSEYPIGREELSLSAEVKSFLPTTEADWEVAVADYRAYADLPTMGAEVYTREEYLREKVEFDDDVPGVVQERLRELLPALAAQESGFQGDARSPAGAVGILQFMPATWEQYTGESEVSLSLVEQAKVAGEYLSDIYQTLHRKVGEERWEVLQQQFDTEEEFYRDLVAPLVLTSYNTGQSRIAEVVQYYVDSKQATDMPTGENVFLDIVRFGERANHGEFMDGFGKDGAEYVPKILARHTLLTEPSASAERYAMHDSDS